MYKTKILPIVAVTIIVITFTISTDAYDLLCGTYNVHSAPDSNSPVVGRVSGSVDVVCQTTGSAAIADMSPGSSYNIWDQLQDGNYINDLYVHTGACGFNGLPRC